MSQHDTLSITTASGNYPILIGDALLDDMAQHISPYVGGSAIFIVTDDVVAKHYLAQLQHALAPLGKRIEVFTVAAGEQAKSFTSFEQLCTDMLAAMPDRRTTLLALGGGVVGDLTGFVASVLLRGVAFIQVPTTILAQVDSSVGGKTAINCSAGKNLIGSFYQPACVVMDLAMLDSLPRREILAGYAEIIKYGLLGDAAFYNHLLTHGHNAFFGGNHDERRAIITHCCQMKATIVSQDEKEQGTRALLNLGHTFGHAIEKAAGYDGRVLHGEAVALGCLMAVSLSIALGDVDAAILSPLHAHYEQMGLPRRITDLVPMHGWAADTLTSYCYHDKKADSGRLTFIRLHSIGDAVIDRNTDSALVQHIFKEYV